MKQRKQNILRHEARTGQIQTQERQKFNADLRRRRAKIWLALFGGGRKTRALTIVVDDDIAVDNADCEWKRDWNKPQCLRGLSPGLDPSAQAPVFEPTKRIGQGASGDVYKIPSRSVSSMFPHDAWLTGHRPGPDDASLLAVKRIRIEKELKLMLSSTDEMTSEDILDILQKQVANLTTRCEQIYSKLANLAMQENSEVAPFIVIPRACSLMKSPNPDDEEYPWLVLATDLVQGQMLKDMLTAVESPQEAVRLALLVLLQGFSVLSVLWKHHLYHNDYHSRNIMVTATREKTCKLTLYRDQDTSNTVTITSSSDDHLIPMIRIIDFDMATLNEPRDNRHRPDPATTGMLPFVDAVLLFWSVRNILKISRAADPFDVNPFDVGAVTTAVQSMVKDSVIDYEMESRSRIVPSYAKEIAEQLEIWNKVIDALKTSIEATGMTVDTAPLASGTGD